MIDSLINLMKHDLNQLKVEINAFTNESHLWIVDQNILNPAGNLCLHVVGNLKTYIGANMGGSGYIRHRDLEFSLKNVPRSELIQQIDETIALVENSLKELTPADLSKVSMPKGFDKPMTTEYLLILLSMHLAYHLGQINYHRRLLD